ncbi:hypothetical protein FB382_002797 [Nocardioides ginsengisegetis]|uniref:Uncharacterized protein n=1 Tax=Nocardioides ginsengisegetis TaxID=661491 RepID=A0A7W3PAH8_9ACTN|nr:hypothetical protein [Nocardioides ginsengisegetis]MBA8804506.1 hypothetical protein [Nocardioides ginsengisegetis]
MHSRLSGLALALTLSTTALASGCESDPAPAAEPTTSSPSAAAGPAVVMPTGAGVFTSCVILSEGDGDYLWSGTQFRAKGDATLDSAGPHLITNASVVGSWVAEDAKDDGIIVAWKRAGKFLDMLGPLTPAKGASLTAGTTYRLVLRLRPIVEAPQSTINGFDVTWSTDDGQGDTLTDPTVIKLAHSQRDC